MRLKDFYADQQRARSEEVDFGSAWRSQGKGPWKVVWVENTGELVAFRESVQGSSGDDVSTLLEIVRALFLAGRTKPDDDVVVLGVEPDLMNLRGALIGWEDHMPDENGLAWLAERVDEVTR